jgi:hypothetical protein
MTTPHLEAIRSATRRHAGATLFVHIEVQSTIKIHQATVDLWFGDCLDSFRCVCRQDLEQNFNSRNMFFLGRDSFEVSHCFSGKIMNNHLTS